MEELLPPLLLPPLPLLLRLPLPQPAHQPLPTITPLSPSWILSAPLPAAATDLYNRLMGTYIEKYLGQGFVIENVTGGAQVIGTTKLADSEPDGYTLGGGWSASFGMRPYLLEVTYDVDDFTFVCGILDQIEACIVRSDAKWNTLDELMEDLKNDPSIKFGAGNAGSFSMSGRVTS